MAITASNERRHLSPTLQHNNPIMRYEVTVDAVGDVTYNFECPYKPNAPELISDGLISPDGTASVVVKSLTTTSMVLTFGGTVTTDATAVILLQGNI